MTHRGSKKAPPHPAFEAQMREQKALDSIVEVDITIDPNAGIPGEYTIADIELSTLLDADALERRKLIEAAAMASRVANEHALDGALRTMISMGVAIDEIEIISEPHLGPGAWRVRRRRKVCECGRSV